jgi:hypothetical protein
VVSVTSADSSCPGRGSSSDRRNSRSLPQRSSIGARLDSYLLSPSDQSSGLGSGGCKFWSPWPSFPSRSKGRHKLAMIAGSCARKSCTASPHAMASRRSIVPFQAHLKPLMLADRGIRHGASGSPWNMPPATRTSSSSRLCRPQSDTWAPAPEQGPAVVPVATRSTAGSSPQSTPPASSLPQARRPLKPLLPRRGRLNRAPLPISA